jgi:hypothetical protein
VIIAQDQARGKICPLMTRGRKEEEGPVHCIGRDCMLWCWIRQQKDTDLGYCGLGGKPDA